MCCIALRKWIRHRGGDAHAYETLETARQALRLGACDYLNKSFDVATLRQAVGNAMERHIVAKEIRENNHRLRELQEDIQKQKMREKLARKRGDVYASVIHDINSPLAIISGYIETINQRLGTAETVEGEKLEIIRDRLNRITRQVTACVHFRAAISVSCTDAAAKRRWSG